MRHDPEFKDNWEAADYQSASLTDLLDHIGWVQSLVDANYLIATQLDEEPAEKAARERHQSIGMHAYDCKTRVLIDGGDFRKRITAKVKVELRRRALVTLQVSLEATSYEYRLPAAIQAQTITALIGTL